MKTLRCDVLVIGSGPGGATTAAWCAEAGRDVLIVEEGPDLSIDSAPSYSMAEMAQKYRNSGLTPAFGKTNITYIEGRCVGGGSEINAALYHRPLASTLDDWQRRYQIDGFSPAALDDEFDAVEAEVGVATQPGGPDPQSERLIAGAQALGWRAKEIARFWKYERQNDGALVGRRRSMTESLIPRARAAGARLLADTRVSALELDGDRAVAATAVCQSDGKKEKIRIEFSEVVVAAGAVQTPALLRRSGLTARIGDSLQLHPMIRVAVRFPHKVADPSWGVPVHQVEEFKPQLTLGCSHSSLPHIALWLAGEVREKREHLRRWEHLAVFYAAIAGSGLGSVRNLPGFREPLVRYPLTDADMALLGEGVYRLGQLVFAAGALEMIGPIEGAPPVTHPGELGRLRTGLPHGRINVTTIHLFSTCPMGEDPRRCAVDSFGRLHGYTNIRVNDASVLPASPGVNPQGTILAIARRNVRKMLSL